MPHSETRPAQLAAAAAKGALSGLAGVAAMTLGEQLEQWLTKRPDSYVPGRTLLALLGRRPSDADRPAAANHLMHWSTGATLGALRGVWAVVGIRGRQADVAHAVVRLAFDQTLENASGVGAPPGTWPRGERVVDVAHKTLYSVVTGVLADRWMAASLQSTRGTHSH